MRKQARVLGLVSAAVLFAACSGTTATPSPASQAPASQAPASQAAPESSAPASPAAEAADVRLQLQWAPQAQFAGYFAAKEQGYFDAENLNVEFLDGGPTVVPQQVGSAPDGPEFTISWVPKVLEARESGSDLVDIAQIFQRSGTLSVAWKDSGIEDPCGLAGKKVGVWDFGNEFEVTAGLSANCGLTPGPREQRRSGDAVREGHPGLRHGRVPEQGDRRRRGDDLQRVRPGPRGDEPGDGRAVQARGPQRLRLERLPVVDAPGRDLRPRGVAQPSPATATSPSASSARRSRAGCTAATTPTDCVQYALDAGSQLGAGHQAWQMNEVNALVWPSAGRRRRARSDRLEPDGPGRQGRRDHQAGSVDHRLRHDRSPRRPSRASKATRRVSRSPRAPSRSRPAATRARLAPSSTDGRSREGPAVRIPGLGRRPAAAWTLCLGLSRRWRRTRGRPGS